MCTLYERIMSLCKDKGVSGSRMCLDLGLSKSTLSDMKSGRKKGLSTSNAQKIANYLGVSVDFLLGEEENDWVFAFRQNLCEAMSNYDSFDYSEAGVDQDWLCAVANGEIPLTFKIACDVADILGESFDSLLGRDYINQAENSKKAPTENGERSVSDDDIKFALFGGDGEITDEMYDEVKRFAEFVKQRGSGKK